MSEFITGVMKYIQHDITILGENGDIKLESTQNLFVDLFDQLVRDETYENMNI